MPENDGGDGSERGGPLHLPDDIDAATSAGSAATRRSGDTPRTRVAKTTIRFDPAASLALCAILEVIQQRRSFTDTDDEAVGLWATRSGGPSSPQPATSGETMFMNRTLQIYRIHYPHSIKSMA